MFKRLRKYHITFDQRAGEASARILCKLMECKPSSFPVNTTQIYLLSMPPLIISKGFAVLFFSQKVTYLSCHKTPAKVKFGGNGSLVRSQGMPHKPHPFLTDQPSVLTGYWRWLMY